MPLLQEIADKALSLVDAQDDQRLEKWVIGLNSNGLSARLAESQIPKLAVVLSYDIYEDLERFHVHYNGQTSWMNISDGSMYMGIDEFSDRYIIPIIAAHEQAALDKKDAA